MRTSTPWTRASTGCSHSSGRCPSKRMSGREDDEAVLALKAVVKKYDTDMKNWPTYIKQIKRYCAKM